MSIPSCTSPRVSTSTLPISRVMARAIVSLRSRISSPARNTISARLGAGTSRQDRYARRAASTASPTSSGPEAGNSPRTSPFAGLRLQKVPPPRAATQRPPIEFW